jgi:hypothetical protein
MWVTYGMCGIPITYLINYNVQDGMQNSVAKFALGKIVKKSSLLGSSLEEMYKQKRNDHL